MIYRVLHLPSSGGAGNGCTGCRGVSRAWKTYQRFNKIEPNKEFVLSKWDLPETSLAWPKNIKICFINPKLPSWEFNFIQHSHQASHIFASKCICQNFSQTLNFQFRQEWIKSDQEDQLQGYWPDCWIKQIKSSSTHKFRALDGKPFHNRLVLARQIRALLHGSLVRELSWFGHWVKTNNAKIKEYWRLKLKCNTEWRDFECRN